MIANQIANHRWRIDILAVYHKNQSTKEFVSLWQKKIKYLRRKMVNISNYKLNSYSAGTQRGFFLFLGWKVATGATSLARCIWIFSLQPYFLDLRFFIYRTPLGGLHKTTLKILFLARRNIEFFRNISRKKIDFFHTVYMKVHMFKRSSRSYQCRIFSAIFHCESR